MSKTLRAPKYHRHKPTGQAVVTLSGKDQSTVSARSK